MSIRNADALEMCFLLFFLHGHFLQRPWPSAAGSLILFGECKWRIWSCKYLHFSSQTIGKWATCIAVVACSCSQSHWSGFFSQWGFQQQTEPSGKPSDRFWEQFLELKWRSQVFLLLKWASVTSQGLQHFVRLEHPCQSLTVWHQASFNYHVLDSKRKLIRNLSWVCGLVWVWLLIRNFSNCHLMCTVPSNAYIFPLGWLFP